MTYTIAMCTVKKSPDDGQRNCPKLVETGAVIRFFSPLQGKALKEIHAILTETLACFLSGRTKDLSEHL